jgi:hypothetical protein
MEHVAAYGRPSQAQQRPSGLGLPIARQLIFTSVKLAQVRTISLTNGSLVSSLMINA